MFRHTGIDYLNRKEIRDAFYNRERDVETQQIMKLLKFTLERDPCKFFYSTFTIFTTV